jgi:hypothetical protein
VVHKYSYGWRSWMNIGVLDTSSKRLQTRIIIHTIVTIQVYSPCNVLCLFWPQTFIHNQYIFSLWVTSLFIPMKSSHPEDGGSTFLQITGKNPSILHGANTQKKTFIWRETAVNSRNLYEELLRMLFCSYVWGDLYAVI